VKSASTHATAMSGMSMGSARPSVSSVGGMSMSATHGATNILPEWLAIVWTLMFAAIFVIHLRHVLDTHGQRRLWHSGHVLMALGMAFMFAPTTIDHFNIPPAFWQILFANAAGAVGAWIIVGVLSGRAINLLWIVIATDLAAMVYMWSDNGFVAPVTWLLVTYFTIQAALWATNRFRRLDREHQIPGISHLQVGEDGSASMTAVVAAEPLVCELDLRPTMAAMAIGMAYMFAAMQLLM
jgi:hypothetical protein